jgi:hypothetical protein
VEDGGRTAVATCPCCGYPTIGERGDYDICEICHWEDDGQDDPEFAPRKDCYSPDDVAGGPNADYSLMEARLNFSQFHQMYRPTDTRPFELTNQDRTREALIGIFDALLPDVSGSSYLAALPEIKAASHRISEALHNRIQDQQP